MFSPYSCGYLVPLFLCHFKCLCYFSNELDPLTQKRARTLMKHAHIYIFFIFFRVYSIQYFILVSMLSYQEHIKVLHSKLPRRKS